MIHGVTENTTTDESRDDGVDPLCLVDRAYVSVPDGCHGDTRPVETENIFAEGRVVSWFLDSQEPVILSIHLCDGVEPTSDQVCSIDDIQREKYLGS